MKNANFNQKHTFKIFYAISFAWQLGFLVVIPIGLFLILGLYVDKILKTSPLFIILAALLGFIITAYEINHYLIPIIAKDNQHQSLNFNKNKK